MKMAKTAISVILALVLVFSAVMLPACPANASEEEKIRTIQEEGVLVP